MNWNAIAGTAALLSAIGVVASVVYLARQIGQSIKLSRASQNRSVMESYEGFNNLILGSSDTVSLLIQLEKGDSELSRADYIRARHLAYRMMNLWTSVELSYANMQLGAEEFAIYQLDVKNTVDQYPGLVPALVENLNRYPAMKHFKVYQVLSERNLLN